MSTVIVKAQNEHASAIEDLWREAALDLVKRLGEGHWGNFPNLRGVRARIRSRESSKRLFVGLVEGQVVATISVSAKEPLFWKQKLWREPGVKGLAVFDLTVRPGRQRQGIGRSLMQYAEDFAQKEGFAFVRLDAYLDNPFSNAFYDSIGYENRGSFVFRGAGLVQYEKAVRD